MTEITRANIDKYRTGVYSAVKSIYWKAGPLDAGVLRNFPNLEYLSLTHNQLISLKGLDGCTQLQRLSCAHNKITSLIELRHTPLLRQLECNSNSLRSLAGIENCRLLTQLDCSFNKLESLEGLSSCTVLQEIKCGINCITSFDGIQGCVRLQSLDCHNNKLVTLTGIENCDQLLRLFCSDNKLTELFGLRGCPRLKFLNCSGNNLTSLTGLDRCLELTHLECDRSYLKALTGIERCAQLSTLSCRRNQLKSLDQLVYLRQLRSVWYSDNPLDIQTIQIQRLLNMIERPVANRSVYSDGQNVHNIHIQKTVCESVQNLLKDPKPEFSIEMIVESGMDERAVRLLLEYCDDPSIHSTHLLSFKELLAYVWARVCRSEHKDELIKILGEQITDSECKCFTGRINRLVSVLVDFYPDIVIEISDNSRIGAIIIAARTKIDVYDAAQHRAHAQTLLLEAGYTELEIQPWLEAISD